MEVDIKNKNAAAFAVLCDVSDINAQFLFQNCTEQSKLVQHVMDNPNEAARIIITKKEALRFIDLFKYIESKADTMPPAAVDDFLDYREVYLLIIQKMKENE